VEEWVTRIEREMRELVERYYTAEPLAHYALAFIDDKLREPMRFGPLTVLHYRMFGGADEGIYRAAAAVELFILASDILDDLQDRDAPNQAWSKAPLSVAMHLAMSLMTLSQQAMLDCEMDRMVVLRTLEMMNRQLLKSANGQMVDLVNAAVDEDTYTAMVSDKSASLLIYACMSGVMLAGHEWHDGVAEYAMELGMAAQIQNDVRDLLRWDDKSDFLQRKKTLLIFFLLDELKEQDQWIADYFEGRLTKEEIMDKQQAFIEACERTGASLYGAVKSRIHYNQFRELFLEIPESSLFEEGISIYFG